MPPKMTAPMLEVLFAPAEFAALPGRDLTGTMCVVFDVFRATSTLLTALAHGAQAVMPVADIAEALEVRRRQPNVLLAGERNGRQIGSALTGGTEFDLGNSPLEFTPDRVRGRLIVTTTTNGTRALRACAGARAVLAGAWLNLEALARRIEAEAPPALLLVGSGTHDEAALEDVLAAGALCDRLWSRWGDGQASDSALMARRLYLGAESNLAAVLAQSRNGRRLLSLPDLRDDFDFCAQRDTLELVAGLTADGTVRPLPA